MCVEAAKAFPLANAAKRASATKTKGIMAFQGCCARRVYSAQPHEQRGNADECQCQGAEVLQRKINVMNNERRLRLNVSRRITRRPSRSLVTLSNPSESIDEITLKHKKIKKIRRSATSRQEAAGKSCILRFGITAVFPLPGCSGRRVDHALAPLAVWLIRL